MRRREADESSVGRSKTWRGGEMGDGFRVVDLLTIGDEACICVLLSD